MAKGTDSEEFALLSRHRSGLKREFAFALKVQTELSGSIGRTRARQSQNSPSSNGVSENSNIKRFKRSNTEEESKNDLEKSHAKEESHNDSVKSTREEEAKSGPAEPRSKEEPESGSLKSPSAGESQNESVKSPSVEARKSDLAKPSDEKPEYDLLKFPSAGYPIEEKSEKDIAKVMTKLEPPKRCTGSALESKAEQLVMAGINKEQNAPRGKEELEKNGSKSPREEGTGLDTTILIDDNSEVVNASTERPLRRFTRSALKRKAEFTVIGDKSKVHNSLSEKTLMQFTHSGLKPMAEPMMLDGNTGLQSASLEKPLGPLTRSALELRAESLAMDRNCEAQNAPIKDPKNNEAQPPEKEGTGLKASILFYDNNVVHNASMEKPQRRFTRSALKLKAEMLIHDDCKVQNALLEKPMRRLTHSTLDSKVETMVPVDNGEVQDATSEKSPRQFNCSALELKTKSLVMGINNEVHNDILEKPLRRFTRSALKPKAERREILVKDTQGGSSAVSEDACKNEAIEKGGGRMNDVVSQLGTPPKNKLEMKMSKKIALTKFPSKAKELLKTGMLEGLPVKYIFRGKKNGELQGMIKDHGILCFCTSCKGCNVITPMQFERHAGSTNKHPAYYIYLENGNSLVQVLNECKSAPLYMLEATIKSAIGCSPIKIASTCLNCKRSLPASYTRRRIRLCNSCWELKKTQESPAHTASTDARLPKPILTPKSLDSASKRISPQNKSSQGKLKGKSSKTILAPKSLDSASKSILPHQRKLTRKSSKTILTPKSLGSASKSIVPQNRSSQGKLTRKDLRLHKLVFEEGGLPDGTELAYYASGQKLLEGYKKGFGIFCHCCKSEISPSQFEAHAGWASRRKPYLHIFTSNGVSLHELSISLSKGRKFSASDNDDLCHICADFGDLLLCDGCPRAFHNDCVGQSSIPRGDWYCPYCQNMFEREKFFAHNVNAKAAGRVSGVDPIEQISKRCIRIVKTPGTEIGGCTLCRCTGFSKSGFGPRTIILCDQCEKEYHVGCLKDHKMDDLKELPKGKWFCSTDCRRIHSVLQKLIVNGSEMLPDSLSKEIKEKLQEKCANRDADFDVRWRLLSGKITSPKSRSLLSKAVAIFHNRFDPIVDSSTGRDLIPSMVYGRNMKDQEFGGMYCAVLTVDSSVVSAGILRIFGQEAAELPLVATSSDYQGQGCFQALFSCIERLLGFLKVKNLVLPAADEAEALWTQKFGFKKMSYDQLSMYSKDCQMTIFHGTSMLEKPVPKCRIINKPSKADVFSSGSPRLTPN